MTWPESVDEALCFGWIDGIRKRIDEDSYAIRFTPRRRGSIWSAVNIGRATVLVKEQRMQPAGMAAFEARIENKSGIYSYEQRSEQLPEPFAGTAAQKRPRLAVLPGPATVLSQSNRLVGGERQKGGDTPQAPGKIDRGIGPWPTVAIGVARQDIPVEGRRKSSTIPDAKNFPYRSLALCAFCLVLSLTIAVKANRSPPIRIRAWAARLTLSFLQRQVRHQIKPRRRQHQGPRRRLLIRSSRRTSLRPGTKSSHPTGQPSDCFTGDREHIRRKGDIRSEALEWNGVARGRAVSRRTRDRDRRSVGRTRHILLRWRRWWRLEND